MSAGKGYAREAWSGSHPHITSHALLRFRERVGDLPEEAIRAVLSFRAVRLAIEVGAPFVRLGSGQHLVIRDGAIVTVLPKDIRLHQLSHDAQRYITATQSPRA